MLLMRRHLADGTHERMMTIMRKGGEEVQQRLQNPARSFTAAFTKATILLRCYCVRHSA
jgi:hypothetical protein